MWRALSAVDGEIVCFIDADGRGPRVPTSPRRWWGHLCSTRGSSSSRATTTGRSRLDEVRVNGGGGRVNHLMARPALALLDRELACVRQPLAGEVAARRSLLDRLPFVTGYGVEIAMLIDAWKLVGLDGLAQVDLEEHCESHQPLRRAHARWPARCSLAGPPSGCAAKDVSRSRPGELPDGPPEERRPGDVALRSYVDLDGTLLGRDGLAVPLRRRDGHAGQAPVPCRHACARTSS